MNDKLRYYVDIVVILGAIISGCVILSKADTGGKLILMQLIFTIAGEIIAHIFAIKFHNNLVVYNLFSIIQICTICIYFNYTIEIFRKKSIGYLVAILCLLWSVINFKFVEPLNSFSPIYLMFNSLILVALSLISFFFLLNNENINDVFRYPHFWFTSLLLFFWSVTFLVWGLYPIFVAKKYLTPISMFIWVVNIITYGGMGVVFQLFPKKKAYE